VKAGLDGARGKVACDFKEIKISLAFLVRFLADAKKETEREI